MNPDGTCKMIIKGKPPKEHIFQFFWQASGRNIVITDKRHPNLNRAFFFDKDKMIAVVSEDGKTLTLGWLGDEVTYVRDLKVKTP